MPKHSEATGDELHVPFKYGLDANKAPSPSVGQWYWATDTEKLYYCVSAGVWTEFSSGGTASATSSFTNGDLVGGVFTHAHGLATTFPSCIVYDNNNLVVIPDSITVSGSAAIKVDLSSYGTLAGTWNIRTFA